MSNRLGFTVTIDGQDQETSEIEVTFDAVRFSLREMVMVEEALGEEDAERFLQGQLKLTPRVIQALLWAKLATQHPEIGLHDFDLPGAAFSDITS